MFARRWWLLRACLELRGDGGWSDSKRVEENSWRPESGDWGRMCGEERGEGILGVGVGARDGERPRAGAVLARTAFGEVERKLVVLFMRTEI